jgi:hypothetical protein
MERNKTTVSEARIQEVEVALAQSEVYMGKTVAQVNTALGAEAEMVFIRRFARGLSAAYRDERCHSPKEFVLAHSDGSEDLVLYHRKMHSDTVLWRLALPGEGKMAYLLSDPRFEAYQKELENGG